RRTTTTAPRCGSRWRWTSRFPTPRPSTCPSRRRPRPSTSPDRVKRSRIVVRELTKTFRDGSREVAAVQGASFEILDGEFVAIVGPSGCGKSTILNMIGGLRLPEGDRLSLAHRGPQHRGRARVPRGGAGRAGAPRARGHRPGRTGRLRGGVSRHPGGWDAPARGLDAHAGGGAANLIDG